ncbi:hypothetical protein MAR_024221, partial [Mya arenaria]
MALSNNFKVLLTIFNDDVTWDTLYDKAANIAADAGVDPSMARNVGRQQNRANAPAHTISEYWKVNMYVQFLDHLIMELNDRLIRGNDRFKVQWLIPSR